MGLHIVPSVLALITIGLTVAAMVFAIDKSPGLYEITAKGVSGGFTSGVTITKKYGIYEQCYTSCIASTNASVCTPTYCFEPSEVSNCTDPGSARQKWMAFQMSLYGAGALQLAVVFTAVGNGKSLALARILISVFGFLAYGCMAGTFALYFYYWIGCDGDICSAQSSLTKSLYTCTQGFLWPFWLLVGGGGVSLIGAILSCAAMGSAIPEGAEEKTDDAAAADGAQTAGGAPPPPPPPPPQQQEIINDGVCVLCKDKESNIIFRPCNHVCCCPDCSFTQDVCPVCGTHIQESGDAPPRYDPNAQAPNDQQSRDAGAEGENEGEKKEIEQEGETKEEATKEGEIDEAKKSGEGGEAGGEGGDEDDLYPVPEGDWYYDEDSGMHWSDEQWMYFHRESGQFYDPEADQWWSDEIGEWYSAEDYGEEEEGAEE